MLSAARLVKHARFAGFPAVAGCALGAPGGPRRPACRLPLQGWPGLRGQLRGLSARADSSRNAMFSAAQVRQTPRFARFSARRRRKTPRFAMFSATHISQTPRFAMLSARRLAKHACFARFAAGARLGPGCARRPAAPCASAAAAVLAGAAQPPARAQCVRAGLSNSFALPCTWYAGLQLSMPETSITELHESFTKACF